MGFCQWHLAPDLISSSLQAVALCYKFASEKPASGHSQLLSLFEAEDGVGGVSVFRMTRGIYRCQTPEKPGPGRVRIVSIECG